MGYSVVKMCVICDEDMSGTSNEAYALAKCSLSESYRYKGEEGETVSAKFDSTKKFIICGECLMSLILEKKYPGLTASREVASELRLKRHKGKTCIGSEKKILTENSTQKDVDDLVIKIATNLLRT
jgi:hypothetical protein